MLISVISFVASVALPGDAADSMAQQPQSLIVQEIAVPAHFGVRETSVVMMLDGRVFFNRFEPLREGSTVQMATNDADWFVPGNRGSSENVVRESFDLVLIDGFLSETRMVHRDGWIIYSRPFNLTEVNCASTQVSWNGEVRDWRRYFVGDGGFNFRGRPKYR